MTLSSWQLYGEGEFAVTDYKTTPHTNYVFNSGDVVNSSKKLDRLYLNKFRLLEIFDETAIDLDEIITMPDPSNPPHGGTTNYNDLDNKPKINGVELSGSLNGADIGLVSLYDLPVQAHFADKIPNERVNVDPLVKYPFAKYRSTFEKHINYVVDNGDGTFSFKE